MYNATRAATSFKAGASTARYEVYPDAGDNWRWRAWRSSDRVAASGESFASQYNAQRAAENVRHNAVGPPAREDATRLSDLSITVSTMSTTMNPYGVGESGEDKVTSSSVCTCCALKFVYATARRRPLRRVRCDSCKAHRLDANMENLADALRDHAARSQAWATAASAAATSSEQRNLHLELELRDARRQVAQALNARDRWREVANAARREHQQELSGRCSCGDRFPCDTIKAMDAVDGRYRAQW